MSLVWSRRQTFVHFGGGSESRILTICDVFSPPWMTLQPHQDGRPDAVGSSGVFELLAYHGFNSETTFKVQGGGGGRAQFIFVAK